MNEYSFEELTIGLSANFEVEITSEMQSEFSRLSGDINPLHCDTIFAKAFGYNGCVAFGMLEASFYSRLAGVYLPGKYCLLQEVSSKFCAPVYIGDKLCVSGSIVSRHEVFKRVEIKAEIRNQNGVRVSKALIKAGIHERE